MSRPSLHQHVRIRTDAADYDYYVYNPSTGATAEVASRPPLTSLHRSVASDLADHITSGIGAAFPPPHSTHSLYSTPPVPAPTPEPPSFGGPATYLSEYPHASQPPSTTSMLYPHPPLLPTTPQPWDNSVDGTSITGIGDDVGANLAPLGDTPDLSHLASFDHPSTTGPPGASVLGWPPGTNPSETFHLSSLNRRAEGSARFQVQSARLGGGRHRHHQTHHNHHNHHNHSQNGVMESSFHNAAAGPYFDALMDINEI